MHRITAAKTYKNIHEIILNTQIILKLPLLQTSVTFNFHLNLNKFKNPVKAKLSFSCHLEEELYCAGGNHHTQR